MLRIGIKLGAVGFKGWEALGLLIAWLKSAMTGWFRLMGLSIWDVASVVAVTAGLGIGIAAVAVRVSGILESGGPQMLSRADMFDGMRSDEYPFFPKSANTFLLLNENILGIDRRYLFGNLA